MKLSISQRLSESFREKTSKYLLLVLIRHTSPFSMKICFGYSLEVSHRGASNEFPHVYFHGDVRKLCGLIGYKKALIRRH